MRDLILVLGLGILTLVGAAGLVVAMHRRLPDFDPEPTEPVSLPRLRLVERHPIGHFPPPFARVCPNCGRLVRECCDSVIDEDHQTVCPVWRTPEARELSILVTKVDHERARLGRVA